VQLGTGGTSRRLRPIRLDPNSVGTTSSWAGSYHVLAMGRHFDDYFVTGKTIELTPISGIPAAHPYEQLAGKIRAAGVTGNIGETIAAIFARRYLFASIGDIALLRPRRPFKQRRSPDYIMRLGSLIPGLFKPIVPKAFPLAWPEWWPVESKARSTDSGCDQARRDALKQLVTYWTLLVKSQPGVVGFGLVVAFKYQRPRELRVTLILPRDQGQLAQALQESGEQVDRALLKSCLHGF
jgi:hypothetical protein